MALALVALAIPKIRAANSDDGSGPGNSDAPAMQVDVVIAQPDSIAEILTSTGTLRADESVDLTSETAGKVTAIQFEEGERVAAGDVLVQINDAELQAQKTRAQHRLDLAQLRAERQQALLERGGATQEEVDEVLNQVRVLEAELDLLEAQIEKAKVRAPFSGTIGLRQVSEGAYLSPQTAIATLQRLSPLKVDLSVPEQYAARIRPGQRITFQVRSDARSHEGTVYATEPRVDPSTRTLQLRARAPNPDGRLRPGMFANVTVRLGTRGDALVVPAFAVVPALGSQRVFVMEGGTAQPRPVSLGLRTDSTVQVTDGLAVGDTVITSGIQNLRAGLPVRVGRVE
jgi:membrane fusion protein (multidrug efflux system)